MANLQLKNDQVLTVQILVLNDAGAVVAADPSDVFSVASSNPASLNAAIGATASGAPAVVINALVQQSPGLSITVSDKDGLTAFVEGVDIVQDTAPKAIGLDIADATSVPQPPPAAPGP